MEVPGKAEVVGFAVETDAGRADGLSGTVAAAGDGAAVVDVVGAGADATLAEPEPAPARSQGFGGETMVVVDEKLLSAEREQDGYSRVPNSACD